MEAPTGSDADLVLAYGVSAGLTKSCGERRVKGRKREGGWVAMAENLSLFP
jgi:hypothetical protein